jgi:hypothetical protein
MFALLDDRGHRQPAFALSTVRPMAGNQQNVRQPMLDCTQSEVSTRYEEAPLVLHFLSWSLSLSSSPKPITYVRLSVPNAVSQSAKWLYPSWAFPFIVAAA